MLSGKFFFHSWQKLLKLKCPDLFSAYAYPQAVSTPVQAAYVPTTYAAAPGVWDQIPLGSGKYLPDAFGWERGPDYFSKWNTVPVQLRNNRVRWRTDGQNMRNGFNSASGADPNKYTDKYSNPGSYQGWKFSSKH